MESVLGRYRNLIILVGVLFLQVLGLAVQVKRGGNDTENTRLIRIWVVGAITPFERGLIWIEDGAGDLWRNYVYLRGVRSENRELKDEIERMRLEEVRLNEDAAQARRLQNLLAFKEQFIAKTVAAQVIGSSGSDLSRILYIDKGEDAGLKRDMAVITADGIVGKVTLVYPSTSQVLLINDPSSGVGVILEKSRLQGVLRGLPNGQVVLNDVMSDEQVAVGEKVLTSGGDQIFPKGLPVGTVSRVTNGKDFFLNISVKPEASLSKLEEVLVLVEKQNRQATAEDTGAQRAADILAQRLPSVPDKPAADANSQATPAAGGAKPSTTSAPVAKPANSASNPGQLAVKNPANSPSGHAIPAAGQPGKPAIAAAAKSAPNAAPKPALDAAASSSAPSKAKPVNAPADSPAAPQSLPPAPTNSQPPPDPSNPN
jgi:rod shape-determining protein MreC